MVSLATLLLNALLSSAQAPDTGPAASHAAPPALSAAERYEPVFDELRHLTPRGDRVATVHDFVLQRDAMEFRFRDGHLYLLTPVSGRTVGALFSGSGAVHLAPPLEIEQTEMRRVLGDSVLDARITTAVFVFADSTLAELERRLTFTAGTTAGVSGAAGDALDRLLDGRAKRTNPTLMAALLNGDANGFFYAYVKRERGEDVMFEVDPGEGEEIKLLRGGRLPDQKTQTVCQFPRIEHLGDSVPVADGERDPLRPDAYRIEATIAKNLGFSATTTIRFTARRDAVRWARFLLYGELEVDSVLDEAGAPDTFFRVKRERELWVRFAAPLKSGETHSIRVVYHGGLIAFGSLIPRIVRSAQLAPALDRWFFMKDPNTWFPRIGFPTYGALQAADMDLTFHTPTRYRFASIGRLVDSRVEGDVRTTHWVTERPTEAATFNIGDFEETNITDPRIPPVTLQMNGEGHRALSQLLLGQRNPDEDVSGDVANSLAFFSRVFGPPLFQRYYASEIPYPYGQAFPGLIYLSIWTFQSINESGVEETFRAHEMAHQWWGIGVDPVSYRDAWLSEGFADFSGLWYMQLILKDNEKYFKQLQDSRRDIRARRNDAAPTGLGVRVAGQNPRDYSLMIYRKGAWVLQMLRNMMIDFRTMKEDAFIAMMQDFYRQYRGRRASTRDFQRVVERHLDLPMDWFFDEWVNGTAIPTYILSWHAEPMPDQRYVLRLRIRQEDVPKDFVMPVPLTIEFEGGERATIRVTVRGPVTEAELRVPAEPKMLTLNPLESVLAEVKQEGWH